MNWTDHMRRQSSRASGYTLIELMVAMLIGIFVTAGMIQLFVANRKAYELQSSANFLQENLRYVADRIGWSVRMADFWGGNDASAVTVQSSATGAITTSGNCTSTWATAITDSTAGGGGVFGYTGSATFPLGDACIGGSANYVAGSDVLVLRYADPDMLAPGTDPVESSTISGNPQEVFLVSRPTSAGELFAGVVPTDTTTSTTAPRRYAYAYHVDMFYLRPCSVIASGTTCASSDDGGYPLPTLMRLHLTSTGTFTSDPVLDGIEQINYEYGVATDLSNPIPAKYYAASAMTASQWAYVVSVRISVVAVSPTRDISMPHIGTFTLGTLGNCTYNITSSGSTTSGCNDFTPYGGTKPWQFTRLQEQFVVQLRSRTRS